MACDMLCPSSTNQAIKEGWVHELDTACFSLQAALRVIAEMQRIPMPSPRKAGAPDPESTARSEDNSSSGSQEQENIQQSSDGRETGRQDADHGKNMAGKSAKSCT